MSQFSEERFSGCLATVGLRGPDSDEFDRLRGAYSATGRRYHNREHVSDCLELLDAHVALATNGPAIELALWYHDAVYDTQRTDNEERSADWAIEYLHGAGANAGLLEQVNRLVLATKTHDGLGTADERLIADIDLAILGAEPARFDAFNDAIRQEFDWVPMSAYVQARRSVLGAFLMRKRIFQTTAFRDRFETNARANLTRSLAALEGWSAPL